ncbi:hypothetical protein ACMFMG_007259 [Clarireedia jacksonii]
MDMISSYVQNVEMDAKLALSSIAMQNIKGILVVPADILIAILLPQNLAISFGTKNAIRKMSLDTLVLTACQWTVPANLRRYRGNNGFKRKDHLRQHISGYHKIEAPHVGDIGNSRFRCRLQVCRWKYREQNLRSLDDLTEHMRTQHNSSAYVCDKPSCERVGQNGFGTKKDLQAHIKKDHPSPFQCPHPGCGRVGSNGWLREKDMKKHIAKFHTPNNE